MSMEVDFSTPLTEQERAFLLGRGRYADVERADSAHGGSSPDEMMMGDGTGPDQVPATYGENMADKRRRLLAELEALDSAEGVEEDEDEDVEPEPYESWTVKRLDAELTARDLPTDGTKQVKVERLYADDAEPLPDVEQ